MSNHAAKQPDGVRGRAGPVRRGERRGIVLFVVVVIVVMLSLAGLSFVSEMYVENKAAHVHGDQLQIECVVDSGVEAVKAFCEQSPESQQAAGGSFDNPDLFRGDGPARGRPSGGG